MRRIARFVAALAAGLTLSVAPPRARAENLAQAWAVALGVNQRLQSQQLQSVAAGLDVQAARAARLPTVRSFALDAGLTSPVRINPTTGSGATALATGNATAIPQISILGPGQSNLPLSLTTATIPLYTAGRIRRNIDSANHQLNSRRAQELRAALDLKLAVAEAYIGVLRAQKNLAVTRSNIEQLSSFLRDVKNRAIEGLAIRSDELAAEVSLSNARQNAIRAQTTLSSAWATYNRYLCRPLNQVVALEELTVLPPVVDWRELAEQAMRVRTELAGLDDRQVDELIQRALQSRPELTDLTEQARSLDAQADVTRAAVQPQVGFAGAFAYIGSNALVTQGYGAAALYVDWTILDGKGSRRRAESLRAQERAAVLQRNDQAADVALEVRTRWLDLQQARALVIESRVTVAQSEENIKVVTDRYRLGLSTYTEVLDAENRRLQALTNFSNALYDESLALFRLRRSVGDL
jgi:outer membrane protein TolC